MQKYSAALAAVALAAAAVPAAAGEVAGYPYAQAAPDTTGGSGAPNVSWRLSGAPSEGLREISIRIVPTQISQPTNNPVYWAYNSWFTSGGAWYIGIQPSPRTGFKAIFSAFGTGNVPLDASCQAGADGGSGTHCHLPYGFQVGRSYTLRVSISGTTPQTYTWRGEIRDDASGAWTRIGDIVVLRSQGLLRASAVTFTEFYSRSTPCAQRPLSEAMFYDLRGQNGGTAANGGITRINANGGLGGCNPQFFSNHANYVYLRQGTLP